MTTASRWRISLLITVLTVWPAAGAETIGGSPVPQDLAALNPGPGTSCQQAIAAISGLDIGPSGAVMTVTNTGAITAMGYVTINFVVDGVPQYVVKLVKLTPGASAQLYFTFLRPVSSPIAAVCANYPIGVVEDAEPIASVVDETVAPVE